MDASRERLKNLFIILLDALTSNGDEQRLDRRKLREMVLAAGYTDVEAGDIVPWLAARGLGAPPRTNLSVFADGDWGGGNRILTDPEREYLDPETFGYLLALDRTGQISIRQRENILHFLSHAALEPLGLEDLDEILDQVLLQRLEEQGDVHPPDSSGLAH